MKQSRQLYVLTGLLVFGIGLPRASFAVTGCSNAQLTGTYDAQVSGANLMSVVTAMTGSTGGTTTGGTTTGGGTAAATTFNPGGFGNNPASLSGQIPGVGRYFFDGSGNIVGMGANGL